MRAGSKARDRAVIGPGLFAEGRLTIDGQRVRIRHT